MEFEKKFIPKKSDDISKWYNKVVIEAELADYGPARGTIIFRPYGFKIWELIQQAMAPEIKAQGVENAYFPLFIPESLIQKEKEHLEGFSPELAVVTIGGGKELEERLIVRPTSETIMYHSYAKWVKSWRDLPILINQWNNVVRWEMRTYIFLRTTEFLWQEGHTAHATHKEAIEMERWAMNMYSKVYREYFSLPGIPGIKSKSEKFAGAAESLSYESLMPDGKALQSCTSHDLGQNFSKVFDIKFQDKDGKEKHVWQTSWGLSTRSLGALVLAHGDDNGLKLPPKLAPIQVIIVPVDIEENIFELCRKVKKELESNNIRAKIDTRDSETLGFKINKWELKGVPIRIEVGEKEIMESKLTAVRRDTGEKNSVHINDISEKIPRLLDEIQNNMFSLAKDHLENNTFDVADDYKKFKEIMLTSKGFIKAFWCESEGCEERIKEETKATARCLPLDSKEENGKCIYCKDKAKHRWVFAQAY